MKIAWITNNINQLGGVEKVICGLSNTFTTHFGCSVEVISINSFEDHLFFSLNDSVSVRHCKLDWREETFCRLSKLVGEILQNLDADVVFTCHEAISYAVILNKRKFKGKVVVTQHCTNDHYRKAKLWINALLYRFADRFVVLTTSDQSAYAKMGCRADVVPNACFNEATALSNLQSKQILAAGRIEHVKGFDRLMEAFAAVAPKHPEWKLCICGGGSFQEALQQQADRLGVSDWVVFPGPVKNMGDFYTDSSVFALSSRNEGLPLVLIEAMSYGLPIMSFDIPSVHDIFADGNCLVAPQGDVQKFAEYLDQLLGDEELRVKFGQESLELSKNYTPVSIANRWIRLFKALGIRTEEVRL